MPAKRANNKVAAKKTAAKKSVSASSLDDKVCAVCDITQIR
jgi:hypothetical protein